MGVTYDTGALIAAERNDRAMWALHRRTLEGGGRPVVPAGVLGQSWRGGPQASLSRLLKGCQVEELTERGARLAGAACARAGTADVIDASVIVSAASRHDLVVTGDADDLRRLVTALDADVEIYVV